MAVSWEFNRGRIVEKCDVCGQFVSNRDEEARWDERKWLDEYGHLYEEETLICGRCVQKEQESATEEQRDAVL